MLEKFNVFQFSLFQVIVDLGCDNHLIMIGRYRVCILTFFFSLTCWAGQDPQVSSALEQKLNCALPLTERFAGVSLLFDPFVMNYGGQLFPLDGHVQVETLFNYSQWSTPSLVMYIDAVTGMRFYPTVLNYPLMGLRSIYSSYGPAISEHIVAAVKSAESELSLPRLSSITVVDVSNPTIARGFMRVSDGCVYPPYAAPYAGAGHLKFEACGVLPLQIILARRNIYPLIIEQDRQAKYSIFEIGKYNIFLEVSESLTRAERQLAAREMKYIRKLLMTWLLEKVLNLEEDDHTFYYAHVATQKHHDTFCKDFGFVAVSDPALNGGLQPPEYILRVDQKILKEHLLEIINAK